MIDFYDGYNPPIIITWIAKSINQNVKKYDIQQDFFLRQHKPHLGLPRTWIISPKVQ